MHLTNYTKKAGLYLITFMLAIASCSKNTGNDNEQDPPPPPPPPQGQQDIATVDNAVKAFMDKYNVPGLSLAVTKNEKLVYVKAYGKADKEAGTNLTPQHKFRIASVSKPVTAVAVMKLIEEGKLSLNDKVFGDGALLGTTYGTKAYSTNLKNITVKHLLTHTAGAWGNSSNDPMFFNAAWNFTQLINYTLDNLPVQRTPGTFYDYSNFGYCLLGRIIEKVSGKSYAEYVKLAVLTPAGITGMELGGSKLSDRKQNEVKYYGTQTGGPDPYAYNIERMDAHGGWIATPSEMVKFMCAVDGYGNIKDILTGTSIQTMTSVPSATAGSNYALGWGVSGNSWWHMGSLPGLVTEIARNGSNGVNAFVAVNIRDGGQFANDLDVMLWNAIVRNNNINWQNIDQFK